MGVNGARAHGALALEATWPDLVAASGAREGSKSAGYWRAVAVCVFGWRAAAVCYCLLSLPPSPCFSQGRCLSLLSTALSLPIT